MEADGVSGSLGQLNFVRQGVTDYPQGDTFAAIMDNHAAMTSTMLEKIVQLAQSNPDIDVVWLYGSRARGGAQPTSDYDLAIAFVHPLSDPIARRIRPETLASEWSHQLTVPLSVVDITQAPLPLAFSVVEDNCPLFVRDDFTRMVIEQRIMSKWELDHLYHRRTYA